MELNSVTDDSRSWRVGVVETLAEWDALRPIWNELAGSQVFCRFEWMRRWWESFGFDRGRPYIVVVADESGKVRGLAPWWLQTSIVEGRMLQFLGSGEVCSDYLTLLARNEDRLSVACEVAAWLSTRDDWDVLELDGTLQDDESIVQLVSSCRELGSPVSELSAMSCWRLELPAVWEDYVATLSKSHRKQVRRVERRCLQTGQFVLREAKTELERRRVFAELVRLHQMRWQSVGESGVFASRRFLEFLQRMSTEWFIGGRVRLYELVEDDRTWAAEIHFTGGGTSYAYQAGVDPEGRDRDVGHMMNVAVIRSLIAEGMTGLDFLRGDEPYKAHFRAEPRATCRRRISSPRWSGKLRHQAWLAKGSVKSWVKSACGMGKETT